MSTEVNENKYYPQPSNKENVYPKKGGRRNTF